MDSSDTCSAFPSAEGGRGKTVSRSMTIIPEPESCLLRVRRRMSHWVRRLERFQRSWYIVASCIILSPPLAWIGIRWKLQVIGEDQVSTASFHKLTFSIGNAVKLSFTMDLIYQDMTAAMWCSNPNVTRDTFQSYVKMDVFKPGLITMSAISTALSIRGPDERAAFENDPANLLFRDACCANSKAAFSNCAKAAADGNFCSQGLGRFHITQFGSSTSVLMPAVGNSSDYVAKVGSEEYLPVHMIEPFASNARVWGFNLLSEPTRRAAWRKAKQTGKKSLTRRIVLVQSTAKEYAFLVFLPVFAKPDGRWTTQLDGQIQNYTMVGSVNSVYKTKQLLEGAVNATFGLAQLENLAVYLFDNADELNGNPQFLASFGGPQSDQFNAYATATVDDVVAGSELISKMELTFADVDAKFLVIVVSSESYLVNLRTDIPLKVLLASLGLWVISAFVRVSGHPDFHPKPRVVTVKGPEETLLEPDANIQDAGLPPDQWMDMSVCQAVILSSRSGVKHPFLGAYQRQGVLYSRPFFLQSQEVEPRHQTEAEEDDQWALDDMDTPRQVFPKPTPYALWFAEESQQWVITKDFRAVDEVVLAGRAADGALVPWEVAADWEVLDGSGGFTKDKTLRIEPFLPAAAPIS